MKAQFITAIHTFMVDLQRSKNSGFVLADQLVAAVIMDESVVRQAVEVHCSVELQGSMTRGQLVVDWQQHWKKGTNVKLITKLDQDKLQTLLARSVDDD